MLENFGFRVLEEFPTALSGGNGYIHDFRVEVAPEADLDAILARELEIECSIANVLCGVAEDDEFNQLVLYAALDTQAVVWIRAWFRYLRQTGSSFGLITIVDALRRAPHATRALIGLFVAAHDPTAKGRAALVAKYGEQLDSSLAKVRSIDDDRILRRLRALVEAIVRTNAFAPAAEEALAFKINSSLVPTLLWLVPWREIWVYSPRVEGIHLRGGPVARGGIRWSDRRDDFRTEILAADEGAAGQERGDRTDRRQGRFLSSSCRRCRTAMHGSPKARRAIVSSSVRCFRSPTISSTTRSSTPTRW